MIRATKVAHMPIADAPVVRCPDAQTAMSYAITLYDPTFLRLLRDCVGKAPDEGGLIGLPASNWCLSLVIPLQPHFLGQPGNVGVCWGFGLATGRPGNFIAKPMAACNGREIMIELLGHIGINAEALIIIESSVCIPCMMPVIVSQIIPTAFTDSYDIAPHPLGLPAFDGQPVARPEYGVSTIDYPQRRSIPWPCHAPSDGGPSSPAVYRGKVNVRGLAMAFMASLGPNQDYPDASVVA